MPNLTDAADVGRYLGVTLTADQAAEATLLLPAADAAIQRYTDRAWLSPAITGEVYQPEGPILVLRQRPVASIERVQAGWYMAPPVTLTVGSQYSVRDLARGLLLLTPWSAGRPTERPYQTLLVDYTPASTVPEDVRLAATMLVANWLQPTFAGDGNDATPGAVVRRREGDVEEQYAASATPGPAGSLPAGVVALLAPFRAALTFA